MNNVKHGFEDVVLPNIIFSWKKLIPPLYNADRSVCQSITITQNKPVLLIVYDGNVQIDFGLDLIRIANCTKTEGFDDRKGSFGTKNLDSMQSSEHVTLNKSDWIFLTGEQIITLIARSAWSARILIIETKINSHDEFLHNKKFNSEQIVSHKICRNNEVLPVGQIGLWRSLSQPVQETLSIDLIHLLIGPSNSWLGANYHVFSDSFRLIEIKLPEDRCLPQFKNTSILFLIGLSGSAKIKNNLGFSDWINEGTIVVLQSSDVIFWDIENVNKTENIKFLLLITDIKPEDDLLKSIKLKQSLYEQLFAIQGTLWSKISWTLLKNVGIQFE